MDAGPNKPCYLCGKQGHSTMTCPFRCCASCFVCVSITLNKPHQRSTCRLAVLSHFPECMHHVRSACQAGGLGCLLFYSLPSPVPPLPACGIAPGHGCTVAAGISSDTVLCSLRKREHGGRCGAGSSACGQAALCCWPAAVRTKRHVLLKVDPADLVSASCCCPSSRPMATTAGSPRRRRQPPSTGK